MLRIKSSFFVALLFLPFFALAGANEELFSDSPLTSNDGILVTDQKGNSVVDWQPDVKLIPASTLKVATAFLAINKWGLDHQFKTEFWVHGQQLWVRGYGDPYLVSEEIDDIVEQLSKLNVSHRIKSIGIDASYFQIESQEALGRSQVLDPYNAPLSAVSANFNTVFIRKTGQYVRSAEAQTPLTPTALGLAKKLGSETTRINLFTQENAQQHFAELLQLKLNAKGFTIDKVDVGNQPAKAKLLYTHNNSHSLETILKGSLYYSNNFIANQLFVLLSEKSTLEGEDLKGLPSLGLNLIKAQQAMRTELSTLLGNDIDDIYDGAGLSRKNQMTPRQLEQILTRFKPHRDLLKHYEVKAKTGVYLANAKTGTLNKVRTFAGYLDVGDQTYQFVFMFNREVPFAYRDTVLANLADHLYGLNLINKHRPLKPVKAIPKAVN